MKNREMKGGVKMKQKQVMGIAAFAIIAILGIGLISAYGFGNGQMNNNINEEDKIAFQEQRDAIRQAVEDNDYETWKSLMEQRISQFQKGITEENFQTIIEKHSQREEFRTAMQGAREAGDYTQMQELKEQYGMGNNGNGLGGGKGFGNGQKGSCMNLR